VEPAVKDPVHRDIVLVAVAEAPVLAVSSVAVAVVVVVLDNEMAAVVGTAEAAEAVEPPLLVGPAVQVDRLSFYSTINTNKRNLK
jgi:hypothetical protein